MSKSLALWHRFVETQNLALLHDLLDPDCVFYSPVVHTPQRGRDITSLYLAGAVQVLGNGFDYAKEVVSEQHAVLEFNCEVDGIQVNGVDIISFNAAGKISEFKVMLRPLKAVNIVHEKMQAMLQQAGMN